MISYTYGRTRSCGSTVRGYHKSHKTIRARLLHHDCLVFEAHCKLWYSTDSSTAAGGCARCRRQFRVRHVTGLPTAGGILVRAFPRDGKGKCYHFFTAGCERVGKVESLLVDGLGRSYTIYGRDVTGWRNGTKAGNRSSKQSCDRSGTDEISVCNTH